MKLSNFLVTKYSGAGNTFAFLAPIKDHKLSQSQVISICRDADTDGLIYLSKSKSPSSFFMHFFNSDGSEPGLCGNGLRSSMAFLKDQGFPENQAIIQTPSGEYLIGSETDHLYSVSYPEPSLCKRIHLAEYPGEAFFVDVGIPHLVIPTLDLENLDILHLGALLRNSKSLDSNGANVNFYSIDNPSLVKLRTYERGVEGETLACGTGALSTFWVIRQLNTVLTHPLPIEVRSGDTLYHQSHLDPEGTFSITQSGPVQKGS